MSDRWVSDREKMSAPRRNRTSDPWLRKPMLYPLSYRGVMVPAGRQEETTGSCQ